MTELQFGGVRAPLVSQKIFAEHLLSWRSRDDVGLSVVELCEGCNGVPVSTNGKPVINYCENSQHPRPASLRTRVDQ